jgi:hypothetical protein
MLNYIVAVKDRVMQKRNPLGQIGRRQESIPTLNNYYSRKDQKRRWFYSTMRHTAIHKAKRWSGCAGNSPFKQAVRLTKQMTAIQTALDGINPLNAGKKRDEIIALLKKFFPGMEDFEKQVRKHHMDYVHVFEFPSDTI